MIKLFYNCQSKYGSINGITTTIVDTYLNLKRYGYDVKLYIYESKSHMFDNYRTQFDVLSDDDIIMMNRRNMFKCFSDGDLIITNLKSLDDVNIPFFIFVKKKVIFVDSLYIFISTDKKSIINNKINKYYNYIQLCNPWTRTFLNKTKRKYTYIQKLSKERLDFIAEKYKNPSIDKPFFKTYDCDGTPSPEVVNLTVFDHKSLLYKRVYKHFGNNHSMNTSLYVENVGKTIFEFRYLGRPVYYSPENKTIDDGLTHYLALFGIDDNKEQEITITKEDIENTFFMKDDDFLLRLVDDFDAY